RHDQDGCGTHEKHREPMHGHRQLLGIATDWSQRLTPVVLQAKPSSFADAFTLLCESVFDAHRRFRWFERIMSPSAKTRVLHGLAIDAGHRCMQRHSSSDVRPTAPSQTKTPSVQK